MSHSFYPICCASNHEALLFSLLNFQLLTGGVYESYFKFLMILFLEFGTVHAEWFTQVAQPIIKCRVQKDRNAFHVKSRSVAD